MATYYVRKSGSDGNAGTSAGAAWLTLGKALGASGIASGDTVYIGAGTYRELVTVNMTSATAETKVVGDVEGRYTGDAGYVVLSNWTTDDKTAAGNGDCIDLNGRDYLTFENLIFNDSAASGAGGCAIDASTQTSTNIVVRNCSFRQSSPNASFQVIRVYCAFGVALNWTVERCSFLSVNQWSIYILIFTGTGTDYDVNFNIRNCIFIWGGVAATNNGASANEGNGVYIDNCTFIGAYVSTNATRLSLTYPSAVNNCYILNPVGYGVYSGESGNLTESYNVIIAGTPRTNVTAGTGSVTTNYAPTFHVGEPFMMGLLPRPPFSQWSYDGSMMAFGDDGAALTTDFTGKPKPAGGRSVTRAIGHSEFHDCGTKETGTVRTGSNAMRIKGPGVHDFRVPVDASSTTITVYTRWDATYAGTKPSMSVVQGGNCGVSDATDTATGSSGAWEQLSLNFTPTAAGVVTVRLTSSDTNGAGETYWDDFDVA